MKVPKTIQMESIQLNDEQYERISKVMSCHKEIYNALAFTVCASRNLDLPGFRSFRNDIRKRPGQRKQLFGRLDNLGINIFEQGRFPSAIWTMALHSLCANRQTQVEQLVSQTGQFVCRQEDINENEAAVLLYCLKVPKARRAIIDRHPFPFSLIKNKDVSKKIKTISGRRLNQLFGIIRRYWRQRDKTLQTNKATWMKLDKCGYRLIQSEKDGKKSTRLIINGVKKNEPVLEIKLTPKKWTSLG